MILPLQYQFLLKQGLLPRMVSEGLAYLGLREVPGKGSNPIIMGWAKEFKIDDIYKDDDDPWCALAHAKVAKNAGKVVPYTRYELLRAKSWITWEEGVDLKDAILGDTMVYARPGGNHVGICIAEDETTHHILGGNQSNSYCFTRMPKNRLIAVRRPRYSVKPASAQKYLIKGTGVISVNEK